MQPQATIDAAAADVHGQLDEALHQGCMQVVACIRTCMHSLKTLSRHPDPFHCEPEPQSSNGIYCDIPACSGSQYKTIAAGVLVQCTFDDH